MPVVAVVVGKKNTGNFSLLRMIPRPELGDREVTACIKCRIVIKANHL